MKLTLKVLTGLTATALLLNCTSTPLAPEADLTTIATNFKDVSGSFSLDFWKKVEQSEKDKNYFVSPLSLHTALGMLMNGAGGANATELKNTLKLNGLTDAQVSDTYAKIVSSFPAIDPNVTTSMANSIWYRKAFPFSQTFLDKNKAIFNATVNAEDFNTATVKKINQWASDNTKGKIPQVIDQIQATDVMFLLNALYFKGNWTVPFDTKQTQDEDFVGAATKKVKMMNLKSDFGFTTNDRFSALELPYGSGKFNMTLVLPTNAKTSTTTLLNSLSAADWKQLTTLSKQKVTVKVPKFTLNYEIKLNEILKSMGMKNAFNSPNDWSKMVSDPELAKKLALSFVKQNTFIAVDEKGTEAAAVTTIGISLTSAPINEPEFFCNRPFLFAIHEKTTGQVIFVGKIASL